ncbi:MAG: adenosylcobinamide-GDP ribazoletransferase [Chloroflexales bacterium]|nr:adenosylcobinamide-GDP ribazoletransferase [Chloroflexales bacterium]
MTDHDATPQDGLLVLLGTALRFLTTLPPLWPVPEWISKIPRSLPYFPLVGAVIGTLLLGVGWVAGLFWPPLAQAALIVVAWAILSGGLHFDGLSDTFDGVMSWHSRERKLEIMRDSRIGAMGAAAMIGVLLLKLAILADAGAVWWRAALVAPIFGRWTIIYASTCFPTARLEGIAKSFQGRVSRARLAGISVVVALSMVGIAGGAGACAFLLGVAGAFMLGRWWTRDLGGLTGDTYGAICEITEVIVLATITAAARVSV